MADLIRLNKYLAHKGVASRREADELISEGLVSINGKVVTEMGTKVDPDKDKVEVNQKAVEERKELIYILLNKPKGYVCSMKRTAVEKDLAVDLIDIEERIYPVGRLDKDTTGLLILTNDGTLTYELTHPSAESEKEYEAVLEGNITAGAIEKLKNGVKLWGEKTLPTQIKKVSKDTIRLILKEGKNRQVRRICQKVGYPVKSLKRIRVKSLLIGDLPLGKWRYLTENEVKSLKN